MVLSSRAAAAARWHRAQRPGCLPTHGHIGPLSLPLPWKRQKKSGYFSRWNHPSLTHCRALATVHLPARLRCGKRGEAGAMPQISRAWRAGTGRSKHVCVGLVMSSRAAPLAEDVGGDFHLERCTATRAQEHPGRSGGRAAAVQAQPQASVHCRGGTAAQRCSPPPRPMGGGRQAALTACALSNVGDRCSLLGTACGRCLRRQRRAHRWRADERRDAIGRDGRTVAVGLEQKPATPLQNALPETVTPLAAGGGGHLRVREVSASGRCAALPYAHSQAAA